MDEINDLTGYVRMERALTDHPVWHHKEPEYYFLFQLLFARAFFSGPKRGTLFVSAQTLASLMPAHFGINRDRIRTMLFNLEKWDMISYCGTRAGFDIKVTNYGKYQADPGKIEATQLKKYRKMADPAKTSHQNGYEERCESDTPNPAQTLAERCEERCEGNRPFDNQNQFNFGNISQFSEQSRTDSRTLEALEEAYSCGSREEWEEDVSHQFSED